MPYTAVPDHRIPYDNDGTLVYIGSSIAGATTVVSGPDALELQDTDLVTAGETFDGDQGRAFFFFPSQCEVTGYYARCNTSGGSVNVITGSNDTTNGMDGTWETASLPSGAPGWTDNFSWRSEIKPISFTGPKKNVRLHASASGTVNRFTILHLYGEAAAGQMAHDLIYIDQDNGGGPIPYPSVEDFGDQPLGTTVVRQFRIKNASAAGPAIAVSSSSVANPSVITTGAAHGFLTGHQVAIAGHAGSTPSINGTHVVTVLSPTTFSIPVNVTVGGTGGTATRQARTATNLNIQCNDPDFALSTDNINWVVTINIASLGPGVESNTLYVRCTTPAPGAALKPRFARIVTVCDAGFFG